jgi:hypothetical protein
VWVIGREQNVKLYPDFDNEKNVSVDQSGGGVAVLYADHPDQRATILYGRLDDVERECSIGSPVYRCFPLDSTRGFVRVGFNPGRQIVLSWKGLIPVAAPMNDEMLKRLGVQPGERFLGQIDGRRFFWSSSRVLMVVARDLENKPVGEWKVPRLAEADGVVRSFSNPRSIAVVGNFRTHGLIRVGLYDYAIVDIDGCR